MDAEISEFHETMERQLECHFPDFQVFRNRQEGDIHNQRDWIAKFHLPETEPEKSMIQFAQKEGATSFIYYDTGKNEEIYELMRNSKMSMNFCQRFLLIQI